jgi:hypothetical protein
MVSGNNGGKASCWKFPKISEIDGIRAKCTTAHSSRQRAPACVARTMRRKRTVAESTVPSIHSAHLSRFRRSREDISSKGATFSDPASIAEVSCRPVRRESSIGLHNSAASVPVLVITTGRRRDTRQGAPLSICCFSSLNFPSSPGLDCAWRSSPRAKLTSALLENSACG